MQEVLRTMGVGFWQDPRSGWWSAYGRRRWARGRRPRRGILKFVVLKLLAEMPRHGYDLIRAFREKGWGGGPGSVYPLLSALEAAGLIAGRDEGERRTYELSEKGRRMLEEHAAELRSFFEGGDEAPGGSDPVNHLQDSASRLMVAVSQLAGSSKAETLERVRELLDGVRKEIYSLLAAE
ncbi:MAG: PadR family transcriptional regulator [Candidatus Eremiobacteraeota bacterium]|nr:PadR family transcriptional regulator [Candidatus Eremiobacteraeota bacterium]